MYVLQHDLIYLFHRHILSFQVIIYLNIKEMVSALGEYVRRRGGTVYRDLKWAPFRSYFRNGKISLPRPRCHLRGIQSPPALLLGSWKAGCSHGEVDKICQGLGAKIGTTSARWSPNKVLAAVEGGFPWMPWGGRGNGHCPSQGALGHLQSQLSSSSYLTSEQCPSQWPWL